MIVPMSEQIDSIHADVAVVGAGPAGAAAAIHAARAGHDTVLIDASPFPRDKTCGDGLTPRAMHQLDLLGIEVNASYRNRGLKLHGFSGSVTAPWPATYPSQEGTALPRYEFDALLVTAAQDAGARLFTGTATDPQLTGNRLTSFAVDQQRVGAKWVIVADGVRSTFGKQLGRQWHRNEVYGIAARAYADSPHDDEEWMHSHVELKDADGVVQPGYGWIFPLGQGVNIGLGALSTASRPARLNTKKALSFYADQQRADWGLGELRDVASAMLPMGGAVSGVAGANWMLIGDAAACVNPLNGEGIDYGLETAALAVDMLGTKDLTLAWPDRLHAEYGEAFLLARTAARLLTYPQFLPLAGPVAMRGPVGRMLMPAAARLMGNLITEEDKDLIARAWRLAGGAVSALRRDTPLWA
ncbi:geranylgeranyl reductase family protein [Corynebacterium minutissimum]|uniref:Geranylgeranyl reductase family protein n=1 Tax=Corynebacterium minutissimum TaxID=38301 RepID=A0A2X4RX10_9CORY|nr:geranylgeranyl reductase family protein [Corynebacterium minutissimum]QPS60298.1 geranylgeranyl reductase family protein [Corynebacterium minutissimum]QQA78913.1 geranylgeranyl reductase family protein [Corynebacterium minutissimum]SQI00860.1 oxidoreductase [Corynebacterium minutissimum]VEG05072.1 oxidoreductase [Corynebacterium minutissimum]